jgi:hypothetical protein
MYKAMPKKLREDKDIDALVNDVHAYLNIGKVNIKQCTQKDIDSLTFLSKCFYFECFPYCIYKDQSHNVDPHFYCKENYF